MLIPSARHTAADLAHWRMLEAKDALYWRQHERRLREMAARSVEHARAFVAAGPCYLGVSWGKDSVLLASLVHGAGIDVPLVYVRVEPHANPDNELVRRAVPWGDRVIDVLVRCERDEHGAWLGTGRLESGFARAAERFGDRYLSGVRADESYARTMRARGHGVSTARTSAPLIGWSNADVYAWAHGSGMPLHPVYGMTAGGRFPREHLRVATLGGSRGTERGRREHELRYYRRELESLGLGSRYV